MAVVVAWGWLWEWTGDEDYHLDESETMIRRGGAKRETREEEKKDSLGFGFASFFGSVTATLAIMTNGMAMAWTMDTCYPESSEAKTNLFLHVLGWSFPC